MNLERLFDLGPDHAVSAQDVFTNRLSEVEAFAVGLRGVREERQPLPGAVEDLSHPRRNVLVFYGMGGIGKTTLSRELQRRFDKGLLDGAEHRVSLRVDFGELSALDLEATLLRMRGCLAALGGKWPTFDLAMAAYWERKHPGEPLREFIEHHPILSRISATIGIPDQIQSALDSLVGGMGSVGMAW